MPEDSPTPFDQGLFLVHLNRGKELFDKRHFIEAAEELEKARRMRPSDETVLNLLGLLYFKNERYKEADRIYGQLIGANPDSEVLHFNQGLICFKLGHLDRAEAAFLRALELTPENQKVNFYLGTIYEKKRQYYNAIFQYRKAGANIMVQRVQSKIAAERAAGTAVGVAAQSPEDTFPPRAQPRPKHEEVQVSAPPPPADFKITVDHIDKTRFLSALRERSFEVAPETHSTPEGVPPTATPPPPAAASEPEEPLQADSEPSPTETLAPGVTPKPPDETAGSPVPSRTVVEMTEPVIPDVALMEMSRTKTLSAATEQLFASRAPKAPVPSSPGDDDDTVELPSPVRRAESHPAARAQQSISLAEDEEPVTTRLYSRLRRRDDIFRYLENNLMEVNFSGKVFIKQGTIYSYSGNLTFWVKPQRDESATPLVIVSGTGKLILSDRQREISVMQINGEKVFVEPSHLLACQETLTPRYAMIKKEGEPRARFQVLAIEGTGMIALSVSTAPLLLKVTSDYPVNISSAHVISWSGNLTPTIVEDEALADLMFPHTRQSLNLRLEGTGKVMMEKLTV